MEGNDALYKGFSSRRLLNHLPLIDFPNFIQKELYGKKMRDQARNCEAQRWLTPPRSHRSRLGVFVENLAVNTPELVLFRGATTGKKTRTKTQQEHGVS